MGGLRAAHIFLYGIAHRHGNFAIITGHAAAPDAVEALRATVLVPVLLGVQR
jgi:hypothetical protein